MKLTPEDEAIQARTMSRHPNPTKNPALLMAYYDIAGAREGGDFRDYVRLKSIEDMKRQFRSAVRLRQTWTKP